MNLSRAASNDQFKSSRAVCYALSNLMRSPAGDLKLDGLRVNQLKLCKQLAGSLSLSERGLRLQARGQRPDEALDLDLAPGILRMPAALAQPAAAAERGGGATDGAAEPQRASNGFSYGNYDVDSSPGSRAATRQLAGSVALYSCCELH